MKIKPSLVCVFEQPEMVCIDRVCHRRIDPETGDMIDLSQVVPSPEQAERLLQLKEDTEETVKRRYEIWNQYVPRIEDSFKKVLLIIQTDVSAQSITDLITDAIQNPMHE